MQEGFFQKNVFRCVRNLLIANILFTVIIFIVAASFVFQGLYNIIFGPFELDKNIILDIPNIQYDDKNDAKTNNFLDREESPLMYNYYTFKDKFYFTIEGDNVFDPGVYSEVNFSTKYGLLTLNKGKYISSYYQLLQIDNKLLVVKAESDKIQKRFSGIITPVSPDIKELILKNTGGTLTKTDLLPFMLNSAGKFKGDIFRLLVFAAPFFLFNIFIYIIIIMRSFNLKRNPAYKRIGFYGNEEEIIQSINCEVAALEDIKWKDKKIITPSWTLRKSLFKFIVSKNIVEKKAKYKTTF